VLSTPPAFILSQDQTLRKEFDSLHRAPKEAPAQRFGSQLLLSYHSLVVKVLRTPTSSFPSQDFI
jgi:hypothetical protein